MAEATLVLVTMATAATAMAMAARVVAAKATAAEEVKAAVAVVLTVGWEGGSGLQKRRQIVRLRRWRTRQ